MTLPAYVRVSAVAAPALLLLYGVLRFIDGLDGRHGGPLWSVGHCAFFVSFVLLAVLLAGITPVAVSIAPRQWVLPLAALVAGLLGTAAFLWVCLGDLFTSVASLPGPLELIGPLLFEVGALILLVRLVLTRPRLLPAWSPIAIFAGFLAIGAVLDLLPLGALLIGAGLAPLWAPAAPSPSGRDDHVAASPAFAPGPAGDIVPLRRPWSPCRGPWW